MAANGPGTGLASSYATPFIVGSIASSAAEATHDHISKMMAEAVSDLAVCNAAYGGRMEELERILAERPRAALSADEDGRTGLHWAASAGHAEAAAALLAAGADAEAADEAGWTAAHIAASGGKEEVLALLLARGADVGARNHSGCTCLHYAASKNAGGVLALLLAAGAATSARDRLGETPLHRAAARGNTRAVAALLDAGAAIDAAGAGGNTAAHLATAAGELPLVMQLMDAGADFGRRNAEEQQPMDLAPRHVADAVLARLVAEREAAL